MTPDDIHTKHTYIIRAGARENKYDKTRVAKLKFHSQRKYTIKDFFSPAPLLFYILRQDAFANWIFVECVSSASNPLKYLIWISFEIILLELSKQVHFDVYRYNGIPEWNPRFFCGIHLTCDSKTTRQTRIIIFLIWSDHNNIFFFLKWGWDCCCVDSMHILALHRTVFVIVIFTVHWFEIMDSFSLDLINFISVLLSLFSGHLYILSQIMESSSTTEKSVAPSPPPSQIWLSNYFIWIVSSLY